MRDEQLELLTEQDRAQPTFSARPMAQGAHSLHEPLHEYCAESVEEGGAAARGSEVDGVVPSRHFRSEMTCTTALASGDELAGVPGCHSSGAE